MRKIQNYFQKATENQNEMLDKIGKLLMNIWLAISTGVALGGAIASIVQGRILFLIISAGLIYMNFLIKNEYDNECR